MKALDQAADFSRPRWDGSRVLFEVADGDVRIPCAISRAALQDLSPRRQFKAADLLLCFVNAWAQIEAIALAKLRARPGGVSGTLGIWADDIENLAPGHMPAPAAAALHGGRPPTGRQITTRKI